MSRSSINTNHNSIGLLRRLWSHLGRRRKVQFSLLLVLMVFTSFAEIFSLGAVLPFLSVLTDPESLFRNSAIRQLAGMLGVSSPDGMLLPLTIAFGAAALLAGGMRLLQVWANTRISFSAGVDLSVLLYQKTLYQPYSVHVRRNSSVIISALTSKVGGVIDGGFYPVLTFLTNIVVVISIMSMLLVIDVDITLFAFGCLGVIYGMVITATHKKLSVNSLFIARQSDLVVKTIQEGIGGIRDVLLDGKQQIYSDVYQDAVFRLRRSQGNNVFIGQSPRFGIEALSMFMIAVFAYVFVGKSGNIVEAVPVFGTFAIGAQRMLPALQQLFFGWTLLAGGAAALGDVLDLLDQQVDQNSYSDDNKLVEFNVSIVLRDLSFRYSDDLAEVLSSVNLEIPKGTRVGLIGATGGGKSTLTDVVMGLLVPTSGSLEIDGVIVNCENLRAWQRHIAHVPQSIFLADSSVEENIAFGVPKEHIDHQRVRFAAKQARMESVIEAMPKQYKTFIGERGVRLSGGQRQRIGIARALYKQSDVLILDEATSALDNKTESEIMKVIDNLSHDITVIVVAHRLTSLKSCDMVVELDGGRVKRVGSYGEMIGG